MALFCSNREQPTEVFSLPGYSPFTGFRGLRLQNLMIICPISGIFVPRKPDANVSLRARSAYRIGNAGYGTIVLFCTYNSLYGLHFTNE